VRDQMVEEYFMSLPDGQPVPAPVAMLATATRSLTLKERL
jgi:hypothetical protein